MKYWSVQKRSVIDKLSKKGGYFPNFELSDTIIKIPKINDLYDFMLDTFNRINLMECEGLIFALCKLENGVISEISDVTEFSKIIHEKHNVIGSMWNTITEGDTVLIELEYPDTFNPLYIDINDFQYLMPPIIPLPPYTNNSMLDIIQKLQVGMIPTPCLPSGIAQVHLPSIQSDTFVTYYEIDDINSGKFEEECVSEVSQPYPITNDISVYDLFCDDGDLPF